MNACAPEIAAAAQSIRKRVLSYVVEHNGGYLSQACSSAEMLAAQPGLEDYAQSANEYLVEVYGDTAVVKGLMQPPL